MPRSAKAIQGFAHPVLEQVLLLARRNRLDRPVRRGPPHLPKKLDPEIKARRIQELARDAAHGGQVKDEGIREAEAGIGLEERGLLPGPIRRSPAPEAEFLDAYGRYWDVKAFRSKTPRPSENFVLDKAMGKLGEELMVQHSVIVDTRSLHLEHLIALQNAVERSPEMIPRVLFYHGDDL